MSLYNRKAKFEYEFLKTYTAGIQLLGSEVKYIRNGWANLLDSYCFFVSGELYLKGLDVRNGVKNMEHDPQRTKKLLLNKKELIELQKGLDKGITIIPINIKEVNGRFKCEIALAKGKRLWDKRQTIKDRDLKRDLDRTLNK